MNYIFLPVFNRKDTTISFIEQLSKQTNTDYKLILIDDSSTDGTVEAVKNFDPETVIIDAGGDAWWGGSLDLIYKWCEKNITRKDLVLICNDDIFFSKNYIELLIEEYKLQPPKTLLISKAVSAEDSQEIVVGVHYNPFKLSFKKPQGGEQINCIPTRGLILSWETMTYIGGFYPRLLPHYLSDYEFTYRAFQKGCKLRVAQRAEIRVDLGKSGVRDFSSHSFLSFLEVLFSKRSPLNPVYFFVFVALRNPWPYKLWGMLLVIKNALGIIYGYLKAKIL